jgi:hypothetical protein
MGFFCFRREQTGTSGIVRQSEHVLSAAGARLGHVLNTNSVMKVDVMHGAFQAEENTRTELLMIEPEQRSLKKGLSPGNSPLLSLHR